MPEFSREAKPNREINWRYTVSELKRLLTSDPGLFQTRWAEVNQAVEDAEAELAQNRVLSQGTAEKLDNLYRQFR